MAVVKKAMSGGIMAQLSGVDRQFYLMMRSYELALAHDPVLAEWLKEEILRNRGAGLQVGPPSSPIYLQIESDGDHPECPLNKWVSSSFSSDDDDDTENSGDQLEP